MGTAVRPCWWGYSSIGNLLPFGDKRPEVADSSFVAPGAFVIGAVYLGQQSSVWYGAVLRGDTEPIRIGARTNVQDGCVLHADPGFPAVVGAGGVVGHHAVVHGRGAGGGGRADERRGRLRAARRPRFPCRSWRGVRGRA